MKIKKNKYSQSDESVVNLFEFNSEFKLPRNNKILGEIPDCQDSVVIFKGSSNILYFEPGIKKITKTRFDFNGDNSLIYISSTESVVFFRFSVDGNNLCYLGHDNALNLLTPVKIRLSENDNFVMGNNGMLAMNVSIDTSRNHGDVILGNQVWIGQAAKLEGNTFVESGSIVGLKSHLVNATVPKFCGCVSSGGDVRVVRESIVCNKDSIRNNRKCDNKKFSMISVENLEKILASAKVKYSYLIEMKNNSETADILLEKVIASRDERVYDRPKRSLGTKAGKATEENIIIGLTEEIRKNTKLKMLGKGNVLIFEPGVSFVNSKINFGGDNAFLYFSKSRNPYHVIVTNQNETAIYFDENCKFDTEKKPARFAVSESRRITVGKNCSFGSNVWVRTSDQHPVYDIESRKRVNPAKDVVIGDDQIISDNETILKGRQLGNVTEFYRKKTLAAVSCKLLIKLHSYSKVKKLMKR